MENGDKLVQQAESVGDNLTPRGADIDIAETVTDDVIIPRRSKRIQKPKSFDDSEVYVSTAEVRIRRSSRDQIRSGQVSDLSSNFERHTHARSTIKQTLINYRRSESCPRFGGKQDGNDVNDSNKDKIIPKPQRDSKNRKKKRPGDKHTLDNFLSNYLSKTPVPTVKTSNCDGAQKEEVTPRREQKELQHQSSVSFNQINQALKGKTNMSESEQADDKMCELQNGENINNVDLRDTHNINSNTALVASAVTASNSEVNTTMATSNVGKSATMQDLYVMMKNLTETAQKHREKYFRVKDGVYSGEDPYH